jgi:hypothetical protein
MTRAILLVVLLALIVPSAAEAWTTVNGISDPGLAKRYRDWQGASQIPTPQVTVNIEQRECPEHDGFACVLIERSPMVLVFPDYPWLWDLTTPDRLAQQHGMQGAYYHELGHIRDFQKHRKGFKYRYRDRMAQIMGWRSDSYVYQDWSASATTQQGYTVEPLEQFAMASAWCAFNTTEIAVNSWPEVSDYHYTPTPAQHRAICALLDGPLR